MCCLQVNSRRFMFKSTKGETQSRKKKTDRQFNQQKDKKGKQWRQMEKSGPISLLS